MRKNNDVNIRAKGTRASLQPQGSQQGLSPMPSVAPPLSSQYCFSLLANIAQENVGEIQGGYRIDLDYTGGAGSVQFKYPTGLSSSEPFLKDASINSGSDWVFLSKDGVADFDSRITILLGPDPGVRCLIGARLRGRADLRNCRDAAGDPCFKPDATPTEILVAWQRGLGDDSVLPLALAVAFDVPVEGFDAVQTATYQQCRELGRSLFLGAGKAVLQGVDNSAVKTIALDLYSMKQGPDSVSRSVYTA